MRKTMMAALLALTLAPSAGARANDLGVWHEITFNAPIPCSMVCPYWLNQLNQDLDANGKEDIRFDPCASPDGTADSLSDVPGLPFTKGTIYDDVVVGPAPEGVRVLEWEFVPAVDWDGFICVWLPGDVAGEELRVDCECVLEPWCPVACAERHVIEVFAGRRNILRAYNWSDPMPLTARYRFRGA